jgi:hypothetical protein
MVGLGYDTDDPDSSDVDLRSHRAHIAKARREMVLPIGTKAAPDIDRYIRAVPCTRTRPIRGCGLARRAGSRRTASIR